MATGSLCYLVSRLHIFSRLLGQLLRCSHGNRKSMGFGRIWRIESPSIRCSIAFSFIIFGTQ
ncbi:hypothetical protein SADUNF_Sadunf19G0078300 [Salix dunnii]|uniref:Uncharacterized protein n=1 Tax=Salix dunnii TaxID=1413687 RepID=A0A835J4E4_9ROSI|nr:hypothetical protein SADUNF_Sadunf19G0078300 [Salix dunnii]